jgi:cytochrome c peroxidase
VLPIGTPGGSLPNVASVARGRRLFEVAGCPACHGGAGWSSSRRDYTPPPATSEIVRGQVIRFLTPVGTFDPTADNEIRQNGQPPLGADGFNAPSLLGIFDFGPYLHDGSAPTLGDVLDNRTHRAAGSDGVDTLADPVDRAALVAFLKSIDASTTPFPE